MLPSWEQAGPACSRSKFGLPSVTSKARALGGVCILWLGWRRGTPDSWSCRESCPRCSISAATRNPWPRAFACPPTATSTRSPKLSWGRPKPMCSSSGAMGTCTRLSAPARNWGRRRRPDCSTRSPRPWPTATTGGWCCGIWSCGNSSSRTKRGECHCCPDPVLWQAAQERLAWEAGLDVVLPPAVQVRRKGGRTREVSEYCHVLSALGSQVAAPPAVLLNAEVGHQESLWPGN